MDRQILTISFKKANAKETGREYEYVSIEIDGVEINRIFIKNTEKSYFSSLIGSYQKTK